MQADKKPDLIIGENLQNSSIKSKMHNLNNLFNTSVPNEKNMNSALMPGIYFNEEKKILPLSFSLTSAVFNTNSKRINHRAPTIDLKTMRDSAVAFNQEQKSRGYSPYWDKDFIFSILELFQSDFTSSASGTLIWQQDNIDFAINFMNEWNDLNGGTEEMTSFDQKYLYDNRIKILKENRILFTTMNSSAFMMLSDSMRRDLDFLYISQNSMVYPEDIIYGGISKKTSAFKASSDFLSWLIHEETQKTIIESSLKNKTGDFAILGGFSSLNSVNNFILPQFYPRLTGKIPAPRYILPQTEKPVDFKPMKDTLITSWAIDKSEGDPLDLSEALQKWEKLRIPF